jgi:hypothetical protein
VGGWVAGWLGGLLDSDNKANSALLELGLGLSLAIQMSSKSLLSKPM